MGDDSGTSSSIFLLLFRFSLVSELLLDTTLLLLLCFLALSAGDSCSVVMGGDGGELAGQAGKRPAWKKAGLGGIPRPEAAISWLAMRSWDGVNIAEFGKVG